MDLLTVKEIVGRHKGDAKWMEALVVMLNPLLTIEELVEGEAVAAAEEEL